MVEHPSDLAAPDLTVARVWASCREALPVDAATLRSYESRYACHVGPVLGERPVSSVTVQDVERLLDGVLASGLGAGSARQCKVVLSLLLQHAAELGAVGSGSPPTAGVRLPRPVAAPARALTPGEYLLLRAQLPTAGAQLLADVLVRSGLRVGEGVALSPSDVDGGAGVLRVRRRLSEPGRRLSPEAQRYALAPATKNGHERSVVVGHELTGRLLAWSAEHALDDDGLLLPAALVLPAPSGRAFPAALRRAPLTPERIAALGAFTGPNGRSYQHGTVNGYTTGRCREDCCQQAVSEYSAARRRERRARAGHVAPPVSQPQPRPQPQGSAAAGPAPGGLGVVGRKEWAGVWVGAAQAAGLDFRPLARQARHAHASWLNGAGVSVEEIAGRLGHRDERSTRGYLRPVGPEADPVAVLDALLGDLHASCVRPPGGPAPDDL